MSRPSGNADGAGYEQRHAAGQQHRGLSAEALVEFAEMENRLRAHVLEVLEPTIRKQGLLDGRLREAKVVLDSHSEAITTFSSLREGAASTFEQLEKFRQELAEWDRERHSHEQKTGDRLSMQDIEISALRASMEKKAGEEKTINRTLKSFGDMMKVVKEEIAELRTSQDERIDLYRDKLAKLRDEFETRTMAAESEVHKVYDRQVTADSTISHMKVELEMMASHVRQALGGIEDLEKTKATVKVVDEQQREFSEFASKLTAQVLGLRSQFGTLVDDVKAHFETAAKVVASSTAQQLDDLREQHKTQANRMEDVLREMDEFVKAQKQQQLRFQEEVAKVRSDVDATAQRFHEVSASAEASRKKIQSDLDVQAQSLKKNIRELEAAMQSHEHSRNLRNDIVSMLVENQLISAALDWQDDQDRKNIALFGYKGGGNDSKEKTPRLPDIDSRANPSPRKARTSMLSGTAGSLGATGEQSKSHDGQVLSLDHKCLSCNSNVPMTLAGFKLACLQYNSSLVEFQKATYTREDLIKLQKDMLHQAREQLRLVVGV
eukprot:TRINITY_DN113830_c0_g1_i1.p1 TRINITY_DN113830_c0_g1~~TRINITY_DN113830_c0_g1_i1.p1  ORF type:complete len:549 (+),score=165.41 TRINITY_DN113830_c0_g1_i1:87-1733(+)